jgi:Na+-transporting NADH:ubiquinone oxidoreductase subunit C
VHNTGYVIRFIIIITALTALALAFLSTTFKERHAENEALFNKRAILAAIEGPLGKQVSDLKNNEIQELFNNQVTQVVLNMEGEEVGQDVVIAHGYKGGQAEHIDMAKEKKRPVADRILPLFIFEQDGKKYYIINVRGSGLWDEIWGNIAIEDDFTTIAGVSFDHKGETPGLGAEIKDNPAFPAQFHGKKIYNEQGQYTSVVVRKGGARNKRFEVDGISGATITANGVTEMLYRGIQYYEPYFKSLKQ